MELLRGNVLLFAIACLFSTGCTKSEIPETIPVRGVITYQGKPVPKGSITFDPMQIEEGRPHRPAVSFIEKDGSYSLSTFRKKDGAVPGTYKVWILSSKLELIQYSRPQDIEWLIPEKYTQSKLSGLTAEVPANRGKTVVINFELTN
jgi:hypothetical protein